MAADFVFAGAPVAPFVLATMDAAGGTAAQEAMRLIGGELVAHVPLAGAAVALESISGAPVMVVDLSGAPDDLAHDATRALDALAAVRAWRTVIAMSVSQIDLVMAALGDGADMAHLLCAPDQGEWIGALAVAAARGGGSVRAADDDRERLARLNAEVARIASLLARIGASEDAGRAEEPRVTFAPTPADSGVTAGAVRDVLRARRLRDRFFGTGLFEDPAWDMLLDLFAARLEGGRVSVSSLCIAASVAPTTALRWIGKLTAARLLHRAPDPTDRRRAFVALTDDAAGAMHRYVAALAEARLPFV